MKMSLKTLGEEGMCRCCLEGGAYKDLHQSYTWMGETEIYSIMLRECFNISLANVENTAIYTGICDLCIKRLRESLQFKRLVLRSEETLLLSHDSKNDTAPDIKPEVYKTEMDYSDDNMDSRGDFGCEDDRLGGGKNHEHSSSTQVKTEQVNQDSDSDNGQSLADLKKKKTKDTSKSKKLKKSKATKRKKESSSSRTKKIKTETSSLEQGTFSYIRGSKLDERSVIDRKDNVIAVRDLTRGLEIESINADDLGQDLENVDVSNSTFELCDEKFTDIGDVKNHLALGHKKSFEDVYSDGITPNRLEDDLVRSQICEEQFEETNTLNQHMENHIAELSCVACKKSSDSFEKLHCHSRTCQEKTTKHRRTRVTQLKNVHAKSSHSTQLKHKCSICEARFKNYNQKQEHLVRVHCLQNLRHKCHVCDKDFPRKTNMLAHVKKIHVKVKDNKCPVCKKFYSRSKCLKEHIKTHDVEVFNCDYCSVTCGRENELRLHVKEQHKESLEHFEKSLIDKSVQKSFKNDGRSDEPFDCNTQEQKRKIQNAATLINCSTVFPFRWSSPRGYCCFHCDEKFQRTEDFKTHNSTHVEDKLKNLRRTISKDNIVKVDVSLTQCTLCRVVLSDLNELKNHLKIHGLTIYDDVIDCVIPFKLDDSHQCQMCAETFRSFHLLNQHVKTHFRFYVCEICGVGFINKSRLSTHVLTHNGGSFKCKLCDLVFSTSSKRESHAISFHKLRVLKFKCGQCNERFKEYYQRQQHMVRTHGCEQVQLNCELCPKKFFWKGHLTAHIRRDHSMERNHCCEICGFSFFLKKELSDHLIKHSGERSHECHVCKKSYGRQKTLRQHMKTHDVGRYPCVCCARSFTQKAAMLAHLKNAHSEALTV